MEKIKPNTLFEMIEKNADVLNFGNSKYAPTNERINEIEKLVEKKLTKSYIWFLNNYAHGEICGDEIYSIYDDSVIPSGDIGYKYLLNLKTYGLDKNHIEVFHTNFSESFYFNYYEYDGEEAPVFKRVDLVGGAKYADNFYEFLFNYISECVN